jgi:lysophospholipase L1-like esterase
VLIGASYAKNWRVSSIRGRAIINKGAQGEQTHELRARFDRDVIEENPAAVIIWGFINNLFRSQSADLEPAMEKARSDIAAMVEEAQKHGLQPVLATEVTITSASGLKDRILAVIGPWLGKESYQDRINERVREVNTWMREFAKERDLVLLDFERVLSDKDGRRARAFASKDGSHISAAGYQALSEYVESITIWRAPQQSR